jgi:predicted O-methyltransferase YrrM
MFTSAQLLVKYLDFLLRASNSKGHGIHSPYVFDFVTKVLQDKTSYQEYEIWNAWRQSLLIDFTLLPVQEIGAGSRSGKSNIRSVSSLAKTAAKTPRTAKFIFRIARYCQPQTILELGTSLGLTAGFFSLACPASSIYTIEGVDSIAEKAKENMADWGCKNVRVEKGNLDTTLCELMGRISKPDLVFMDGNHQEEATKRYFLQLLPHISSTSMIIVDDIHWSHGMEKAWSFIQTHKMVNLTIDFFQFGVAFLDPAFLGKSHFKIRY